MTAEAFETHLRELERHATLIGTRGGRETWRFGFNGKLYDLHFYPQGQALSASDGPKEYAGLKTLQDFKIPAVRVVAMMAGFRFAQRKGNAVILHAANTAVRLSEMTPTPRQRYAIADQILTILMQLSDNGIGYEDLSLESFVYCEGRVLIAEGSGVRSGRLSAEQLMRFAHNADPFASTADRVRAWRRLRGDDESTPPVDRARPQRYARNLKRDNVERIRVGEWSGWFRPQSNRPLVYAKASRLLITREDWVREWPRLAEQMRGDQLEILKRDASGDILAGELTLQSRPIDVVVKRPGNKYLYRKILQFVRASRAKRLFDKTRWLLVRQIDVEYPLIVMERRVLGYAVESVAVFEKVPGETLEHIDLDAFGAADRENLFRACGRVLRRIEQTGLAHPDAKSSNWIVTRPAGEADPPRPVLIDAYGVRPLTAFLQVRGLLRLLRAMKNHPQYTRMDSLHLCQGFSPRTMPSEEMGATP